MIRQEWFALALLSAICYSITGNAIFYLGKKAGGYNMIALNFVIYVIVGFVIGPILMLTSDSTKTSVVGEFLGTKNYNNDIRRVFSDRKLLIKAVASSAASVFANICLYSAYTSAPNPGMCDAISSSSAFLSLILGSVFLGSAIGGDAVFGMLMMTFGGYLLLPVKK